MLGPIREPKIISKVFKNNLAIFHLEVPDKLSYFEGHFSKMPVVPGVVQLHWVVNLVKKFWGISGEISEVNQLKFSKLMRPKDKFTVKIEHDLKKTLFKYSFQNVNEVYSSGHFKYKSKYKLCALLPTYNHCSKLATMIEALLKEGLNIIIVNDGSCQKTKDFIDKITKDNPNIEVLHNKENEGKGSAVKKGFRRASQKSYTHVFQIDADGQHSLENLGDFIRLSMGNPNALISGHPIYDDTIPLSRKIGRMLTHAWVWIETLSLRISDSMCGFRIYPLAETLSLFDKYKLGNRMDFDTEVMVLLHWNKVPIIMNPVKVTYPQGNLSNFDFIKDNWLITKMHTRLFFGMLKNKHSEHWTSLAERGTLLGLRLLAGCYRLCGKKSCQWMGFFIAFYFCLTGIKQRKASNQYLDHVFKYTGQTEKPTFKHSFYHFISFFNMALDKFSAWADPRDAQQLNALDLARFNEVFSSGKGGMLLVSHLGNIEFCRAVYHHNKHSNIPVPRIHVLMHSKNSIKFNNLMNTINPSYNVNIIEVTELGLESIIQLKEYIENGEWIVVAADRIPINDHSRVCSVSFLGEDALFSQGPYIMAHLLECQVYTAFAIPDKGRYQMFMECFSERIELKKGLERRLQLRDYAQKYAELLESYCVKYHYQWFNFYNYWKKGVEKI